MKKTLFAGLSVLEPGEPLSSDNGAFTGRDREALDRLLEIGAKTHRHNGSSGVATPSAAPTASLIASGGTLPASISISLGYTVEDEEGGETALSPVAVISTLSAIEAPPNAPTAVFSSTAGTLLVDTYYYAVTFVDGEGGETPLGPAAGVVRPPSFAAGEVKLSGLVTGLAAASATGWRLYRAVGGAAYNLLATGGAGEDTFIDDGSHSLDCSTHPPAGSENTTSATSQLKVTLPHVADSRVDFINLYATVSGDFSGGSLLGRFPVASAGATALFAALELGATSPPPVNRSIGGAHQIDPDTDILDWHWKRPVAASGALGSGSLGDVRLVENTGALYGVLASGGASAAPGWTKLASAGGAGIANLIVRGSAVGSIQNEIETIEFPNFTVTASGAHKAVVRADVTKADLIAEEVARSSGDITERNLRINADAAEAGLRASGDINEEKARINADAAEAGLRASGDINQEKITIAQVAAEAGLRSSGDLNEKTAREGISSLLLGSGVGYIHHGAASAVPRPSGFKMVVWEGEVEPSNASAEDLVVYENSQAVHVPMAQASRNGVAQSLAAGTFTELLFTTNAFDNSGIHSTVTNTGRFTAPKTGIYYVEATFAMATGLNSTTGLAEMVLVKNGVTNVSYVRYGMDPNGEDSIVCGRVIKLNAGDYVTYSAYNPAGTAKNATNVEGSMVWLGTGLRTSEPVDWGVVEALPAAAEVGDFCTYKSGGVFWRLQKVDTTETPWAKIGGAPLMNEVVAQESTTSKVFTGLTTAGPSLTLPLKGEYDIEVATQVFGAGGNSLMSYKIGATGASEADEVQLSNGGSAVVMGSRRKRKSGFVAGVVLLAQYANESGLSASFGYRRLLADPVKVG